MSKAFSTFYDHLLPELPGCTTEFVDLHLLQVARDFCTRTSAWRDTFDTIASQDDTLTYDLFTSEARTELVQLLRLTINDVLLWCAEDPAENEDQPENPADQPPFVINGDGDLITLEEQPEGDIVMVGSMRPTMAATSLPDLLLNDYLEAIRTGTLARLMVMSGKRWTDRDLATIYGREYTRLTTAAASKARGGNTRKPLRTRKWG